MDRQPIGKVSATESSPTTSDSFVFWLKDDQIVAPFDIVAAANMSDSTTYGQITDLAFASDSPSHIGNYVSSDFGRTDDVANTPRLGATYVTAEVLTNSGDVYMPLHEGRAVYVADEDGVRKALGLDRIRQEDRIPAGFLTLSNGVSVEVSFDRRFLIGPEGAHLNVSGISGLAAKTSYIMFVLRALQQRCDDTAVVVLNVKGQDLLHLHESNPELDAAGAADWQRCGLEPGPFTGVTYFYPFTARPDWGYANTACSAETRRDLLASGYAHNYVYTFEEDKGKLDLLFSNVDDPNLTIDSIIDEIETGSQFRDITTWDDLLEAIQKRSQKGQPPGNQAIPAVSWRKFYRLLKLHMSERGGLYEGTRSQAPEKHQVSLSRSVGEIRSGEMYVVDIANLEEQEQCLVFGDIIKTVYGMKLGETDRDHVPERVIVFVDELNKYAPSTMKSSPIIRELLEITERGRSLGVVLFSAQQFKSAVHDRVKGNCGTHAFGRTNVTEVSRPDYRSIPKSSANMMTRLPQGSLVLQHPPYPRLLKVSFPKPCYRQPK